MKTLFTAGLIILSVALAEANPVVQKYTGTATDLKTGTVLYYEEHEATYLNDQHISTKITYRDTKNVVIAEKSINFTPGSAAARFRLEDFRFGTVEGAEPKGSNVVLFNKEKTGAEVKEKSLSIPSPVAIDGGLNSMVRNNWPKLMNGERVDFYLGVPSQLDFYHFRVVKDREETFSGRNALVVRFESDFWFIRLFVDPVVVWYDIETRRALKYEGISNIYDEKGKSYIVRVTFDKPGP
jgi:hypothetical protein